MKKLLSLNVFLVLLQISIYPQQNFWEQTSGPQGGFVHALAVNPSGYIFAGTEAGVFLSTDDGENWNEINNGLPNTYYSRYVESLVIKSDGHIFIGTMYDGIYKSTNNGETWIKTGDGIYGPCMSITTNSKGDIFAGVRWGGIFRSTDDGENWVNVYNANGETDFRSIAINSSGYIFAGSNGNVSGILVSADNGENWTWKKNDGTQSLIVGKNDFIFAGTSGNGALRSTDYGETWVQINNGLGLTDSVSGDYIGKYVVSLAINSDGNLFASAYYFIYGEPYKEKIFRSTDNGDSWLETSKGLPNELSGIDINCLVVNKNGTVFAGMEGPGIYSSTDNGENWIGKNNGLKNTYIRPLLIDSKGTLLAGSPSNGVFRSTDNGNQWVKIFGDYPFVNSIVVNSKGDILVGNNGKGIFRSTDDGDTWFPINNGLSNTNVLALTIAPNGNILVGTGEFDGEIFYSTDNGDAWVNTNHTFDHVRWSFSLATNSSGYIFAGTGEGIYRSTDNGMNWTEIDSGLIDNNVQCILVNSQNYLFIGTQSGVFRSMDNGNSWDEINYGLNNTNIEYMAGNSDGDLFVGNLSGIFELRHNWNNWIEINNNLGNLSVHSLAFNSDNLLFCGTSDGVFHTTSSITSIENKKALFIKTFELYQNYPNPFNPGTKIRYDLPETEHVVLKVFDILGREVVTLVNEEKPAGNYEVEFNGNNLSSGISAKGGYASGVYFYKIQAGKYSSVKKMILIK